MDPRVGEPDQPRTASEHELRWLQAFRQGDTAAFQPLIRPHLPGLLALARRHCRDPHWADDLVQETLVRAFKGLPQFRGEAALRTWLFRILVRLASEPQRWRRGDAAAQTMPLDLDVPDTLDDPALRSAIERELHQQLDIALERLPHRQRTALHLRAVEGMDYAGVAAVLECTQAAARMLVLEARKKILARMGGLLEP
ncbi:MAG: RNA polymerase sigma factor [Planctomycetota bacterium]